MELSNSTALPATLNPSPMAATDEARVAVITAKATFRFDGSGRTDLESANPVPLFDQDTPTEHGLLPRDDLVSIDPAFDVILLGAAYAPPDSRVTQCTVALTVGNERRMLQVFGDRFWEVRGRVRRITAPEPFERMPIGIGRAFGGKTEVLVDEDSPIDVADPINPHGTGWDPAPAAQGIGEFLRAPEGYPWFDDMRPLPNVEHPERLIASWDDRPQPAFWETVPMDIGLHGQRVLDPASLDGDPGVPPAEVAVAAGLWHRAHPDWVIDVPPASAGIVLEGLTPETHVAFDMPRLRVLADLRIGQVRQTQELSPQSLVLLPEERRFYMVYRRTFTFPYVEGEERSVRLRTAEGWYARPSGAAV